MQPKHLLLLAGACVAFVALLLFSASDEDQDDILLDTSASADSASPLLPGPEPGEPADSRRSVPGPTATEGEVEAGIEVASGPPDALDEMQHVLADAFEAGLSGALEPELFLELARRLAALDLDPEAFPEPSLNGMTRFPLQETSESLDAEIRFGRSRNPRFAEPVVSLAFGLARPTEPYLLEGVSREAPHGEITVWTDPEGRVSHFGILLSAGPDDRNRAMGIPVDAGEIPTDVHYSLNVNDPTRTRATLSGIRDGAFGELARPVRVGRPPHTEDLQRLAEDLLALHATVRSDR